MSDTPGRKTPPKFEPPPWEREQFEALAKKKAEEEARAAAAEQQEQQAHIEATRQSGQEVQNRLRKKAEGTATTRDDDDETITDVNQMMVILQAEEPSVGEGLWKAGIAAGLFMSVVGAIFMVWGIVALRATRGAGSAGQLGAGILMFFGIGFIAIAAWMIQRSLRQRGAS